jgi:TolA-binding protein
VERFNNSEFKDRVLYQIASCLYNSGKYQQALDAYKDIIKNTTDKELERFSRYELGWCYYRLDNKDAAIKVFDDYLARYPESDITADVIFWFAQYYYQRAEYGRAKNALNRIIEGFPKSGIVDDASYLLGWTLYQEGDLNGSLAQFKKIIEQYPSSDSAYNAAIALGDVLTESGKFQDAITLLQDLLNKYKDEQFKRIVNKKIALIYEKKGLYGKAVEYFNKVITAEDSDFNAEIQFKIAECMEEEAKFDIAISEYLKVGYLYPKSRYWATRARLRTAQIFEAQERWNDAKKIYEEIAQEDIQESKYARERLNWIIKHEEELDK